MPAPPAAADRPPPSRWAHAAIVTVLFLAVGFVYAPARHYGFVAFDDPENVSAEPHVRGGFTAETLRWAATSHGMGVWVPLARLTYLLDGRLLGLRPGPMHVENAAYHAAAAAMLYAALFAVHPMHVESVAWLTERRDVLSTTLLFAALFAYVRRARGGRAAWYAAALGLYALSLTAKAMGVTFPAVLLLLEVWPLRRWPARRGRVAADVAPFVAIAAPVAVVAAYGQRAVGASLSLAALPASARVANAVVGAAAYLGKLAAPTGLAVFYPLPLDGRPPAQVAAAAALLAALAVVAVRVRRRRPYAVVGLGWFLVTLLPVSGLTQSGSQAMADRYSYLPSVGLFVAAVWGGYDAVLLVVGRRFATGASAALAAAALAVAVPLARRQVTYWRDTRTLFAHAAAVTADNWVADYYVAMEDVHRRDYRAAQAGFERAVRDHPGYVDAHIDLANCLRLTTSPEAAVAEYDVALRLSPADARARAGRDAAAAAIRRERPGG